MDKSKKIRIVASVMAGIAALLIFLLLFAVWQQYSEEKALYEQADSEKFLSDSGEGERLARKISLQRKEAAEKKAHDEMLETIDRREERYQSELLLLVNPWNGLPEDYVPFLDTVEEGFLMDRRCANALMSMLNDCRAAGNLAVICSAYRTQEYQQELFDNKIMRLLGEGVSYEQAPVVAARSVAVPGTSEHQLGLAVDIIDELYVNLDYWQQFTSVQQWLMANCSDYGFILRYPNEKSDITGIIFEPWHYRYVGVSTARAITASGLTFEEYLETLKTS